MADTQNGVEVVALKDLSFRWHLDKVEDPSRWNYQSATRGQKITVRPEELDRLVALGAVTKDTGSQDAELAVAGVPASGGVGGAVIPSEAAQVRAVQSVASMSGLGPSSAAYELSKVDTPTLRIMAKAFGVDFNDNSSKQDLVEGLTKRAEGVEEIVQHRDQVQVAARETQGEAGMLGTNVLSGGRDAQSGEKLDTSEKSAEKSTRSSSTKG